MAQINNPNWIISLYVTYISLTPFAKASGTYKKARPRSRGIHGQRLQQRPWEYSTIGGSVRQEHDAKYVNFLGIRGDLPLTLQGRAGILSTERKGRENP